MKCPYCKKNTVKEIPYCETIYIDGVAITYNSTVWHCSNPDCPEPDRFNAQQLLEQQQQRDEQLRIAGREDIIAGFYKKRR